MALENRTLEYLRERIRRADTILFTGAGFSRGTKNRAGTPVPLGAEVSPLLWKLCFPNEAFDERAKLQDLFQVARTRSPRPLADLLRAQFSIDTETVPEYYAELFSLPWYRVYTLNVDDLAVAVGRRFSVRRKILPVSALKWASRPAPENFDRALEVIHLNGIADDGPDGVTFSPTQYAERLAGQEPLYAQCAADVLSRPVIFVGTPIDESPLWQHVNMRRRGTRTKREFRRQSFIVTPSLDRARRELLEKEFHVVHLPLTTEEFAQELLGVARDVADEGFRILETAGDTAAVRKVPLAGDLSASSGPGGADYLLGRAPAWGDVRDGIPAQRESDADLERLVRESLTPGLGAGKVILVSGTAGCGKSTAVMRLALRLTASDVSVGWVDSSIDISPLNLRRSMEEDDRPLVLVVDDADRYGNELPGLIAELCKTSRCPTIVVTIRSGRGFERFADRAEALGVSVLEFFVPNLADRDIGAVIDALEAHNRLGVLKGQPRAAQIGAFREAAGRQLIVALLEATSGRRFEELLVSEMQELPDDSRDIYAIVAVASALRFGLKRDELLLAVNDASNATLASIDTLQRRNLLTVDAQGDLRVRHRVIADVLTRALAKDRLLADIVIGLGVAAASKIGPETRYGHRHYRRVRSLMNHDWVVEQIGVADARRLYEELEPFLQWGHHYWLQRGSFELEHGDLQLAQNFLNQSYAIEPEDSLVQTEYAYLQLKLAVAEPSSGESRRLLDEGLDLLRHSIRRRQDPHQYHIYGRMALDWLRRGDVTGPERARLLDDALHWVELGRGVHPRNEWVRQLYVDVQNERLGLGHDVAPMN